MAPGPVVRAVVTSSVLGLVYQAFVVECGSARPGGHFPRPGGSPEWWWRCNLCFSRSPHAPTWLPAAVKCGGTRARRLELSADLYLAAWRDAGRTQPVFPLPRGWESGATGSPGPTHRWPEGRVAGREGTPGAAHSRRERATFHTSQGPNETLGRYAMPTGRTLEKCKRHRQIGIIFY